MLKMQNRRTLFYFILLAIGGIITALTLNFPQLGIIEWVSLSPAIYALIGIASDKDIKLRSVYRKGLFFFMCFYAVIYVFFWRLYPMSFTGMSEAEALAVILLAWLGISFIHSLVDAFLFVFTALFLRSPVRMRNKYIIAPFLIAAMWSVLEWIKTLTWAAFPWARLAIGQTHFLVFAQSASLFGSYFVTFLIVLVNVLIAEALLGGKVKIIAAGAAVTVFLSNAVFGAASMLLSDIAALNSGEYRNSVTVSAIQPNINTSEKWSGVLSVTDERVEKYVSASVADGAKIIVMPETVYPIYITESNNYSSYISEMASDSGAILFVGAFEHKNDDSYNSIFMISADGAFYDSTYSKRHLVPFGEYLPAENLLMAIMPSLSDVSLFKDRLNAGEDSNVYTTEYGKIGGLVCFDSVFEELALDAVRNGAELFIVSTNDSWFFDSPAVYMHNAQSQLRAIECGRYVIRSANTGISSIIDSHGRIIGYVEPLIEGYVSCNVRFISSYTLFDIIGNIFVYAALGFSVVSVAACFVLKIKNRKNRTTPCKDRNSLHT